ncbi:MAG: hypothetical protein J2P45_18205, partial [Candidatus Dormibacteraeota bacterium]|nr:hypothetical protein [Candidatus Dormibacteraeota bacterium]
ARAALGGRLGERTIEGNVGARLASPFGGFRRSPAGFGELELEQVRDLLSQSAGPLRSGEGLEAALRGLTIARGATDRAEEARRLAVLVVRSALLREESRGAHVRTDHPREVDSWAGREVVIRTGLEVRQRAA